MNNPYGGWPGGLGPGDGDSDDPEWYDPRYRHDNSLNLVMIDRHTEIAKGTHVGEIAMKPYDPERPDFEDRNIDIDWEHDGSPYYWHYKRNPYTEGAYWN